MTSTREIIIGIYGAWRLLLLDRSALRLFDVTIAGFWKSFYAALVVLPFVIIVQVMIVSVFPDEINQAPTVRSMMVFAIDYVYQWTVFPLVMIYLAEIMARNGQYTTFIVARNWAHAVQIVIFLPAAIFVAIVGADNPDLARMIILAAYVAAWAYEWFIARTALEISGSAATVIVLISIAISFGISRFSQALVMNGA
ncbi:MAG: hypothetical protein GKS02_05725 [Alphaproteobacteria bacterium]|nr:hypothetical protein [Alphaproteobacteria bacterium]